MAVLWQAPKAVGSSKDTRVNLSLLHKAHHTTTADLVSWGPDDPNQTVGRREAISLLGQENSFGDHYVVSCNFSKGMHMRRQRSFSTEPQRSPTDIRIQAEGGQLWNNEPGDPSRKRPIRKALQKRQEA